MQGRGQQSSAEESKAEKCRGEQSKAVQRRAIQCRAVQRRAIQCKPYERRAKQCSAEDSKAVQRREEQRAELSRVVVVMVVALHHFTFYQVLLVQSADRGSLAHSRCCTVSRTCTWQPAVGPTDADDLTVCSSELPSSPPTHRHRS